MGIETAKWVLCDVCEMPGVLDIDLLEMHQVPKDSVNTEVDKEGDLWCPTCRNKVVSMEKAKTDEKYMYYNFDFESRNERVKAKALRIDEADPAAARYRRARSQLMA